MAAFTPIGIVHSRRTNPEDGNWDPEKAHIDLDSAAYIPESLTGFADFSHSEILF